MPLIQIKSNAKINVSLGVLGKLKSKLHRVESLVTFIDLNDDIKITPIKKKKHKVIFYGKFSKGIPKINTITSLLTILDKKNLLKNKKYLIKIKKKNTTQIWNGWRFNECLIIAKLFSKIKNNKIKKAAN